MPTSNAWKFQIPDGKSHRVFTIVFPEPVTEREARAFVRDQFNYVRIPKGTTVTQTVPATSNPARQDQP